MTRSSLTCELVMNYQSRCPMADVDMSGETPNRLISALNPLEIGSTVHYAGHDWTVTGERSGKDWPAELLDYVLLVRDQHTDSFSGEPCFTSMGVRLADLAHLT